MSGTGTYIKKNLESYHAANCINVQERAIHTTEKLATWIRSHSRIKEIQTKAKNPMALVKARWKLKYHVNFYLILNDYIMTGNNCTGWQEWGLIRKPRTRNKPSTRAWKGKARLSQRNREDTPNVSGETRPSRPPTSSGSQPGPSPAAPRSCAVLMGSISVIQHRSPLSQRQTGSGARNGNLSCRDRHGVWRLP